MKQKFRLALIVGALLGALAGWTLRKAVRNEVVRLAKLPTTATPTRSSAAARRPW